MTTERDRSRPDVGKRSQGPTWADYALFGAYLVFSLWLLVAFAGMVR